MGYLDSESLQSISLRLGYLVGNETPISSINKISPKLQFKFIASYCTNSGIILIIFDISLAVDLLYVFYQAELI